MQTEHQTGYRTVDLISKKIWWSFKIHILNFEDDCQTGAFTVFWSATCSLVVYQVLYVISERVQGAPNIIPQGLPDIHQSTRPVQPRPQGQLLNPGHNSNMANSGSNSTNSGNNVEIPSSNSTNSSSNVKNPGSHVGEAVPTSSVFVPNFEPMDVDPFPSLLTQDSAASADSGVATSTSGIADETSVKKVYQPAPQVYPPAPPAVESRPPQASRSGVTTETQVRYLHPPVTNTTPPPPGAKKQKVAEVSIPPKKKNSISVLLKQKLSI